MPQVWAVIGPTASGKSDIALGLAQRYGGEIISCDSVQVYRYFDIGSAKPSPAERSSVPHHLIDILDPLSSCTAGFWRDSALKAVSDVQGRGKVPIIAGGTGLYFKALYQGLFEGSSTDSAVRSRLGGEAEASGVGALYSRLQSVDASYAAKISPNDRLRIIRALEAFEVTGQPFSELHRGNAKPDWEWTLIMPALTRETLNGRIALRTEKMLSQGLIEETRSLAARFPSAPALGAIGYREALSYIRSGGSPESLKEQIVLRTRQFAKRQASLFRSLFNDAPVHAPEEFL